ncbi:hypothetical protein OG21DRAFT_1564282, partial [Imleria badia]
YAIPHSNLAIRIWQGGMQPYEQFCLDFFDTKQCVPVNTPVDFELWDIPRPGVFSYGGKLISWEAAFHNEYIPAGEEKYSVPEGSHIALKRPGEETFLFQIPFYSTMFACPQAALS